MLWWIDCLDINYYLLKRSYILATDEIINFPIVHSFVSYPGYASPPSIKSLKGKHGKVVTKLNKEL